MGFEKFWSERGYQCWSFWPVPRKGDRTAPPIFFFAGVQPPSPTHLPLAHSALSVEAPKYSCPRLTYATGVGLQWMTTFLNTGFCLRRIWCLSFPFLCYPSNECCTLRFVVSDAVHFLFKKEVVNVTTAVFWIIRPLLLEYYEAEIKRVFIFFMETASEMLRHVSQNTNFHIRRRRRAPYFLNTVKFKGKFFLCDAE